MSPTPRIGLLGAGHHHLDAYARALRAAGATLVGLHDRDEVRGRAWCATHAVPWVVDAAELVADDLDAVVVCSETAEHRADVELAAAAGVPVLCEKPLATRVEDAEAMVAACAQAGVELLTAFPMRSSPAVQEAVALVRAGRIGEVLAATGVNQGQLPTPHRAWFVDPDRAGGGALLDHVVHLADVLRWVLDDEVAEVHAVANRVMHATTVGVETGAIAVLRFHGGVVASIDASWSRPGGYPTWGGLGLELVGTAGVLEVDAFAQRLRRYGGPGSVAWPDWGSDVNVGLVGELLAAARGGPSRAATGADGLAATRIALAAAASARQGRPVRPGP